MNKEKIYFGVVGAGFIGCRHIAMIDAEEQTELSAVCDIRSIGACGIDSSIPFYNTIEAMLCAHPEIDVVSICTPNGLHAAMAIKVLDSGRSVVVEKPMALTVEEAEAIGAAEQRSSGRLFSVFQNRYTPTSAWVKELLQTGGLGDLRQIVVNCMWNRDERYYKQGHWHGTKSYDGGTLFTQFSHFVDILLWLVGPIEVVNAAFADFCHGDTTDFEDTGTVVFRTVAVPHAIGTFNYSTAVPMQNLDSSIIIVGSKGSVKIGGQYMNEVTHCNIENYTMPVLPPANPPNDYGAYKGSAANHCYVIRNVAETILDGAAPTADWHDGYNVVKTICDIYALRKDNYESSTPLSYKPC